MIDFIKYFFKTIAAGSGAFVTKNHSSHLKLLFDLVSIFLVINVFSPVYSKISSASAQSIDIQSEPSKINGFTTYYVPLSAYDLKMPFQQNSCYFQYKLNGRRSDSQLIYSPFYFRINLPNDLYVNSEISWNNKPNIFEKLSNYSSYSGNVQYCNVKGSISIKELYDAAWRTEKSEIARKREGGDICISYGMHFFNASSSNLNQEFDSIFSPYSSKGRRLISVCWKILEVDPSRLSSCTVSGRRAECEKFWARRSGANLTRVPELKDQVEAILRGEQLEIITSETEASYAKYLENEAKKKEYARKQAEAEERDRQWLLTPEGKRYYRWWLETTYNACLKGRGYYNTSNRIAKSSIVESCRSILN